MHKLQAERQDASRQLAEWQVAHQRRVTDFESKQRANSAKKQAEAPVMRLLMVSHLVSCPDSQPADGPASWNIGSHGSAARESSQRGNGSGIGRTAAPGFTR